MQKFINQTAPYGCCNSIESAIYNENDSYKRAKIMCYSKFHIFKITYCKYEPSKMGVKSNWRRCGSSVAPRKPIDALVAIMLIPHTTIPGIFNKVSIEAEGNKRKYFN